MSYPVVDNNHAAEAQALFTDHYRNKVNVQGVMASFMPKIQELETLVWQMINAFLLATPPVGDQLDKIGSVVGCARGVMDDPTYLYAIKLQIRINRSQGTTNDVLDIARLALQSTNFTYVEPDPQNFGFLLRIPLGLGGCSILETLNISTPLLAVLLSAMTKAKSLGTRMNIHYSQWTTGNDFRFVSRYGGLPAGQGTWGSHYTSSVGGKVVATARC